MVDLGSVLIENDWSIDGKDLIKESSELKLFIMDYYQKRGLKYKSSKIENSTSFVTLEGDGLMVELTNSLILVTGTMPPSPKDVILSAGYWSRMAEPKPQVYSFLGQAGPVKVKLHYNDSLPVNELVKYLPFRFLA